MSGAGPKRGRGRPKKIEAEEAQSDCVIAEGLTNEQLHKLGEAIDMVPAVGGIPAAARQVLLEAIAEVLPSLRNVRRSLPQSVH